MSKTQALNTTQTHNKLLDDNKELIRIIGTALYPAIGQLKLYQEALKEIRSMKFEGRTSYELKTQEKVIAWEKSLLSKNCRLLRLTKNVGLFFYFNILLKI
jgi:hypothetical protein